MKLFQLNAHPTSKRGHFIISAIPLRHNYRVEPDYIFINMNREYTSVVRLFVESLLPQAINTWVKNEPTNN